MPATQPPWPEPDATSWALPPGRSLHIRVHFRPRGSSSVRSLAPSPKFGPGLATLHLDPFRSCFRGHHKALVRMAGTWRFPEISGLHSVKR